MSIIWAIEQMERQTADDVVADRFYYEPNTKQILAIPPAPPKPIPQPTNG